VFPEPDGYVDLVNKAGAGPSVEAALVFGIYLMAHPGKKAPKSAPWCWVQLEIPQ